MSGKRNCHFVATTGRVLAVCLAVCVNICLAGPTRLWFSLSQSDPYRFSTRDPSSAEPQTVDAFALVGTSALLHLWGQPQTQNVANVYNSSSNPFRQLQNISFDATTSGPGIALDRSLIHNPDATPFNEGGNRYGKVVDSNHPTTIVNLGGQMITSPRSANGGIVGLSGFTFASPTVDTGIGPTCDSGAGVCVSGPSGPAWLLGSLEIDPLTIGDFEIHLQIGAQAITHTGEQTPETQVILGAADGIVYNSATQRQITLLGDSADIVVHVVERLPGDFNADGAASGADFLAWQRGNSPLPLSSTDLAEWETNLGLAIAASPLPGDFNGDGTVNGADFLSWQRGDSPMLLSASDLTDWEDNFGPSAAASASTIAIPEPGTVWLGLVGVILCLGSLLGRSPTVCRGLAFSLILALTTTEASAVEIDANWLDAAGGNWNDATNWDAAAFPNNGVDTYNVTIDATGGPYTVTLNSAVTIDSLLLDAADATVDHRGNTLSIIGDATLASGEFRVNGGTLVGGTWIQNGGVLSFSNVTNNRLDGTTILGDLTLNQGQVTLLGGAQFTGDATINGNFANLLFDDDVTLDNKTITVTSGRFGLSDAVIARTLTLGPNMQLEFANGLLVGGLSSPSHRIVNQGTISGYAQISPPIFDNQGTVEATAGGTMRVVIKDTWTNTGVYRVATGGLMQVSGNYTTAALGTVDNTAGGTFQLSGTLDNSGATLAVDATTGDFSMLNNTIVGGTLSESDGARLIYNGTTLDGTTILGDLTHTVGNLTLRNGATFNGDATIAGRFTVLAIDEDRTLDNKTITVDEAAFGTRGGTAEHTLTFGPNTQVNLVGGILSTSIAPNTGGLDSRIVNQGTISGYGSIQPGIFDNQGTVVVTQGKTLGLNARESWTNSGVYRVQSGGRLHINGSLPHDGSAQLTGSGTVAIANFTNEAAVRPGNSPGILTIEGDYTQTSDGLLEIEIGGLTVGTEHDRLVVTGAASLAGRVEMPLINGFTPAVGNEVVFLTAPSISGAFENVVFPNELPVDVAQRLVYSPTDIRVEFVAPIPIDFVSDDAAAEWTTPTDWVENGANDTPDSVNILSVSNNLAGGQTQTVDLFDPAIPTEINAAHSLTIGDATDDIVLRINDTSLSSSTTTTITAHGVIQQTGDSVLSGRMLDVQGGGRFTGMGTVVGKVEVGMTGTVDAMFEPGIGGVGNLEVVGEYSQGPGGLLAIDITGDNSGGNHDTIDVTGAVAVDGTIKIDVSGLTDQEFTPGAAYKIVETIATATGQFKQIEIVGRDDIYFQVNVGNPSAVGGNLAALTDSATEIVEATGYYRGDGDQDGDIDDVDAQIFAAMLVDNSLGSFDCGENCFAAANFLDAFDFFDPDIEDKIRTVDFFDIPRFAAALAGNTMSLAAAYETIDRAIIVASNRANVPEPSSLVYVLLCAICIARPAARWRRQDAS